MQSLLNHYPVFQGTASFKWWGPSCLQMNMIIGGISWDRQGACYWLYGRHILKESKMLKISEGIWVIASNHYERLLRTTWESTYLGRGLGFCWGCCSHHPAHSTALNGSSLISKLETSSLFQLFEGLVLFPTSSTSAATGTYCLSCNLVACKRANFCLCRSALWQALCCSWCCMSKVLAWTNSCACALRVVDFGPY